MKNFDTRVYSISDFIGWHNDGLLDLSPKFQRRGVWNRRAKSFLIDTIIRGKPIPKIIITQDLVEKRNMRTVVDGQQRLRAIFDFIKDDFTVLKAHNETYAGRKFSNLDQDVQTAILTYEIGTDLLFNPPLGDLLDTFARINTYSVVLNAQEKLNAKYLGAFKTFAYQLGQQYAQYMLDGGVITNSQVARMKEAEVSSDVLVALVDGVQTIKSIEKYYKKYEVSDDIPQELDDARQLYISAMSYISKIYKSDEIKNTNWSRSHFFYTLLCVIAHSIRPIRPLSGDDDVARPQLNERTVNQWRVSLDEISASFDEYTADDAVDIPADYRVFIDYARRRTTDTEARVGRAKFVLSKIVIG